MQANTAPPVHSSPWSPLNVPVYRAIWIASAVSMVGASMQDVGVAWLMMSLASSPLLVALTQTAASLPVVLLALPAGTLADVFDRRRLLIVAQVWMMVSAVGLGLLTLAGAVSPWSLLAFAALMSTGGTLGAPALQAAIAEVLPRSELPAASALSSVSVNMARVLGPAAGGLLVAAGGPAAVFLLNAVSFLGLLVVLARWQREPRDAALPAERLLSATRAGWRYVRHAPPLQAVLVRSAAFMFCASGTWALLPVLARNQLGLTAAGYGLLLGSMGLGGLLGAVVLPRARREVPINRLIAGATLLFAAATVALAGATEVTWLYPVLAAAGVAWITLMSSINGAVPLVVPAWVRARALSVHLLVFMAALGLGGATWGAVATQWGLPAAFLAAATGMIASLALAGRFPLVTGHGLDLEPAMHWPEPVVAVPPDPDQGPVLITIEYRIDPDQAQAFSAAMRDLRRIRLRDGAHRWNLFVDAADPARFVETFLVESWMEHLRQHARVTGDDRAAEKRVRHFLVGGPPVVSHLVPPG